MLGAAIILGLVHSASMADDLSASRSSLGHCVDDGAAGQKGGREMDGVRPAEGVQGAAESKTSQTMQSDGLSDVSRYNFFLLSLVSVERLEDGLGEASMMRGRGRNRPAVQNREVQEYRKTR